MWQSGSRAMSASSIPSAKDWSRLPAARRAPISARRSSRAPSAAAQSSSAMSNFIYRRQITVEWGHCDPAGIVFNSRFFEFFDWNAWSLFAAALRIRPADFSKEFGIMGLPLVDAKARFLAPAKFNDVLEIASEVTEFRRSSFDVAHRISIDGQLSVEGNEIRVWAAFDAEDPMRLKSVPIPAAVIERFRAA